MRAEPSSRDAGAGRDDVVGVYRPGSCLTHARSVDVDLHGHAPRVVPGPAFRLADRPGVGHGGGVCQRRRRMVRGRHRDVPRDCPGRRTRRLPRARGVRPAGQCPAADSRRRVRRGWTVSAGGHRPVDQGRHRRRHRPRSARRQRARLAVEGRDDLPHPRRAQRAHVQHDGSGGPRGAGAAGGHSLDPRRVRARRRLERRSAIASTRAGV